jgi:hypothetical protein
MFQFLFKKNNKLDARLEYFLASDKGKNAAVSESGLMAVVATSGNLAVCKD